MDIQMLEQQVSGLIGKIAALRSDNALFLKAQGLDEQKEKAGKELSEVEVDLQNVKEELSELQGQKANALRVTAEALAAKMGEVLPEGRALFEIGEDGVFIGWENQGKRIPYPGLSGGQKVPFDQALSHALLGDAKTKVLIYEAAEADRQHLDALIQHLTKSPENVQVILNSCHRPGEIPEGWQVVDMKVKNA